MIKRYYRLNAPFIHLKTIKNIIIMKFG